MEVLNRLVIIGNGFDLAHGLKTSYKNFIDWYLCNAFSQFCELRQYKAFLFEIETRHLGYNTIFDKKPASFEEVLELLALNKLQSINYNSNFLQRLITSFKDNKWVDIERYYYRLLKAYFSNPNLNEKVEIVSKLNEDFSFLISKLTEYMQTINESLKDAPALKVDKSLCNLSNVFAASSPNSDVRFLNFNYTDTLSQKGYAYENEIIHIHGSVSDVKNNPIIFGYGDESDPTYQN